jgi:hypothetical protein
VAVEGDLTVLVEVKDNQKAEGVENKLNGYRKNTTIKRSPLKRPL